LVTSLLLGTDWDVYILDFAIDDQFVKVAELFVFF